MKNIPKNHILFWGSSYDRGLDVLLNMWPEIKKAVPDALLHCAYGWNLFDKAYTNNKERQAWKKSVNDLMNQPGITHHGRVGQDKLQEIRKQCGIWFYPTNFTEIFCITAVEAQHDGLVPVCTNLAALPETAKHGLLVKEGEPYLDKLFALMADKKEWKRLSNKCQKFARKFYWENQASKWDFTPKKSDTRVTIYTPTVRDGFFNIMASNLATQTHKNFEWLIVDGQKESRKKLADKYAKEYGLDIRYIHQKKKRKYGLSNANNLAIDNAKGSLFVFLQDFVLITPTAIEELINVSEKHPGDFIAPVDITFAPSMKPDLTNKEDWFNGKTDIVGKFVRKNVRAQNRGLRLADKITDFEQNFGAVPLSTLKALNGYWEFYDEALGWDDTEIVYRAKALGYRVWIDDTNQCLCLDHDQILGESRKTSGDDNTPRFYWMVKQMEKGLPTVRDPKLDEKIDLQYTIPESVTNQQEWINQNLKKIIGEWKHV